MAQKLDIYPGRSQSYERELRKLQEASLSPSNLALIKAWANALFAQGSKSVRVAKLCSQIRRIAGHISKDLRVVTKADIETLIAEINQEPTWNECTKADYRRCIKQFYRWYEGEDPRLSTKNHTKREAVHRLYRYIKEQIRSAFPVQKIDYSEIIDEQDLQQILERGCANIKERALIATLHEGGFRAGELLNMHIADLEIFDDRIIVQVDGKTGKRRVPLVLSVGYLLRWLEEHPHRGNLQAYLWTGNNSNFMHHPLRHIGAQKLVDRCFKKAGLKKRHNLHWFRHSRATLNAPHMREVMLCQFFGWTLSSRQVRTYVHTDTSQVESAVFKMHGLEKKEEVPKTVSRCQSCSLVNAQDARYCRRCGKPLSVSIMLEDENKKALAIEEAIEFFGKIMSDPQLRQQFEEYKKKTG